jgi:hypothetical protein
MSAGDARPIFVFCIANRLYGLSFDPLSPPRVAEREQEHEVRGSSINNNIRPSSARSN